MDFDQINFILKLRIYCKQILKLHVLLYLKCYKNLLSNGVKILLGQPVVSFSEFIALYPADNFVGRVGAQ